LKIDQVLASVVDPLALSKSRGDCEMALKQRLQAQRT